MRAPAWQAAACAAHGGTLRPRPPAGSQAVLPASLRPHPALAHHRPPSAPVGLAHVSVLLQRPHGQRAKELLGHGEAGEQALKVPAAGELGQAARQLRLGGAGRAQQQQVLAAQRGQQQQAHLRAGGGRGGRGQRQDSGPPCQQLRCAQGHA